MNVCEANRARHLVIRLDRGDELPSALVRALSHAEARAGFITGCGALEAAELAHYDQARRTYERARRIDAPCEVLSLSGNIAVLDGVASVRLSAVLSRETDVGLATLAGQLVWGRAFSLELHVTVFDDLALVRVADDRTGLPVLEGRRAGAGAIAEPRPALESSSAEPPAVQAFHHAPAAQANEGPALPVRPQKLQQDHEEYPDVGDTVLHFHFGECTVVSSDGDRIRLRQDKDGRVLDVALTKLRIERVSGAPEEAKHFRLHRKN
jgi:predicted DNA-binding protein with PD1-like motif